MKAIVCARYGSPDVLKLKEVEKPSPKDNEVLVKIVATAVTSGDCRMRSFTVPLTLWLPSRIALGITKPRKSIPGLFLAGEIETAGKDVEKFHKGDQIYGRTPDMQFGAYAQYTCMTEKSIMHESRQMYPMKKRLPFLLEASLLCIFLEQARSKANRKCLSMELPEQ